MNKKAASKYGSTNDDSCSGGHGEQQGRGQSGIRRQRRNTAYDGSSVSMTASEEEGSTDTSHSDADYICSVCRMHSGSDWVACDSCHIWYHQACINIRSGSNLEDIDLYCENCEV